MDSPCRVHSSTVTVLNGFDSLGHCFNLKVIMVLAQAKHLSTQADLLLNYPRIVYFKGHFSVSTYTLITGGEHALTLSISAHRQLKRLLKALQIHHLFMLQALLQECFFENSWTLSAYFGGSAVHSAFEVDTTFVLIPGMSIIKFSVQPEPNSPKITAEQWTWKNVRMKQKSFAPSTSQYCYFYNNRTLPPQSNIHINLHKHSLNVLNFTWSKMLFVQTSSQIEVQLVIVIWSLQLPELASMLWWIR